MNKSATMTIFLAAAIFLLIIVDMAEAKGKGKKYGPKPKEEKAAECIEQEIGSDVWRFITCKKGKYCVRMTCKGKDVRACYDRADVCTNSMDFVQKYGGGSSKDECHSCNVCTPKDDGKYCNYGGAMDSEEEAPSIKGGAIGSEEAPSTENGAMGGEDVCTANGGDMDGTMAHCAIIWAGLAMALGLAAAAN